MPVVSLEETVGRNQVGEYCTALDMAGASIPLVRLDDEIESSHAAPAEIAMPVFWAANTVSTHRSIQTGEY